MLYFFCFCFCFWLSLIFLVACFGGVLLCFLIVVFTPNFVLFCTAFLLLPSFFFLLSALSSALVCILVFKACSFSCSATLFVKCSYNRVSTIGIISRKEQTFNVANGFATNAGCFATFLNCSISFALQTREISILEQIHTLDLFSR